MCNVEAADNRMQKMLSDLWGVHGLGEQLKLLHFLVSVPLSFPYLEPLDMMACDKNLKNCFHNVLFCEYLHSKLICSLRKFTSVCCMSVNAHCPLEVQEVVKQKLQRALRQLCCPGSPRLFLSPPVAGAAHHLLSGSDMAALIGKLGLFVPGTVFCVALTWEKCVIPSLACLNSPRKIPDRRYLWVQRFQGQEASLWLSHLTSWT